MGRIRNASMAEAEKYRKALVPDPYKWQSPSFPWPECPVCKLLVPDIRSHALNKTDEEHVVLAVHES
jgi:hypothetical protein